MNGATLLISLWTCAAIVGAFAFWGDFKNKTLQRHVGVPRGVAYLVVAVLVYVACCLVLGPAMAWRHMTTPPSD